MSVIKLQGLRSCTEENALVHYLHKALNPHSDHTLEREEVERLLNEGAQVDASLEEDGTTAMHLLALHWNSEIANILRLRSPDVNKCDINGRTPLHTAAANNCTMAIEWLVATGAKLEEKTYRELNTPLHYAARHDAIAAMNLLLEKGSDLEARDYIGRTPLHLACKLDRALAVQALITRTRPANIQSQDHCCETAMGSMISNMPKLAYSALDQFHEVNIKQRVEKFYLCKLEPDYNIRTVHKTPIEVAIDEKKKHLLTHPVIKNILDIKWKFVRPFFFLHLAVYFLFLILWSINFAYPTIQEKHVYKFPRDLWRVIIQVLIVFIFLMGVSSLVTSLVHSIRSHKAHNKLRREGIQKDLDTLILSKDEKQVLESKLSHLKILPGYVKDPWTFVTVGSNVLILVVMALHVANVLNHSPGLALMEARFGCFATIMLWMQLVKFLRVSALFGPVVSIITDVCEDIVLFLIIGSIFYIPFVLSFWVMFGGPQSSAITGNDRNALHNFYDVSIMVFRLGLIDDYPFYAMRSIDQVMTFILVIAFLLLMGLVGLNLFIALLNNVVMAVYEASLANAVLQQALLIRIYHKKVLFVDTYKMYHKYLHEHCNPYEAPYEDKYSVVTDKKQSSMVKVVDKLDVIGKQIGEMHREIGDLKKRMDNVKEEIED